MGLLNSKTRSVVGLDIEPGFVAATVARLAAVRGTTVAALSQLVTDNFSNLTRTGTA